MSRMLVTGASSPIGRCLQASLAPPWSGILVSRGRHDQTVPGFVWRVADLSCDDSEWPKTDTVIHLAPLPLLPRLVPGFAAAGVKRLVAVGTTSRFTKAGSSSKLDKKTVSEQLDAESQLAAVCKAYSIAWTLLRPTMVYDGRADKNVCVIARFIRRWGFFPVAGAGSGLRQPLHARDLACACLAVLDERMTFERAYNLAGGERLTYRAMVERITGALGRRPRIIRVPAWTLRSILVCAALHPRYRYLTAAMADRMDQDMVFDISEARRDFGFNPGPFVPELGAH